MSWLAEVFGSNGSESYCWVGGVRLAALTSGRGSGVLRHEDGKAALFASRELAREAAMAACWNGQRFSAKVARGNTAACGRVVEAGKVVSCQEGWRP